MTHPSTYDSSLWIMFSILSGTDSKKEENKTEEKVEDEEEFVPLLPVQPEPPHPGMTHKYDS